ncbi:MAG: M23 family metallopeptidase [Proteobacteria bacterium]|nr:M23 family metallopeptidase [Pseudomonadota bacterium]MDA1326569.1 M23 family metallopeptidase [Pseudomonadota bacterium]
MHNSAKVVLPLVVSLVLSACVTGGTSPDILSGWGSFSGVDGRSRNDAHSGLDIGGRDGTPILAATDATLHKVRGSKTRAEGCGLGIALFHPALNRWTVYCHLSRSIVKDMPIKRGQVIGYMGTSGRSIDIPHVHFEVVSDGKSHRSGDLKNTEDPANLIVGCYDRNRTYSDTQLSYPVPCEDKVFKK